LLWDPALLQIELPKWHYFPDRTNSKILTFEVKSPWMTDEINLDVMNEDDIIVDRINYQLRWAA
jgi:hypothetical protein